MLLWCLVLVSCIGTGGVAQQNVNHTEPIETTDDDPFYPPLEWSDVFDWKVLTVLSEKSPNVLFSPVSLKFVLAILYEASSGATQKNFESGLQFISKSSVRDGIKSTIDALHAIPSSENKLSLGTRIFLDSGITVKNSFKERIREYYSTDVVPTNFSDTIGTSTEINSWVAKVTMGAMMRLTEPDELKDMIMLLANAVYFKGVWRYPFSKDDTYLGGFYYSPQSRVYVPFMTTTNIFYYFESQLLEAKLLRMPYKNSKFSMFIMLPFSKGGLPGLIENMNLLYLHRELHYLDKKVVSVSIPKFSFKLKASYTDILQKFGLRKIFQNSASLTGIAEGDSSILRQLVVSDILQSTEIEVDEEGSVAHATTGVIIGNKIGSPDNEFNASHPFLFFIQDDTSGTILFLGKVQNPLHQEIEIKKQPDNIEEEFQPSSSPQSVDRLHIR